MPRFYIPPERWNPDRLVLDEAESHHASGVLRLQPGDRATVFNGRGRSAAVEIASVGRRAVELKLIEARESPAPLCRITLGQAVPKGKNMDLIVQKATELGAAAVAPLLTEHTVVQFDARDAEKKREKWQSIAVEASKQCGQDWTPQILSPQRLETLLPGGYGLRLVASLQPGARHPREIFADYERETGGKPKDVLVLIGPEGDFTPGEIGFALAQGCRPITLGPIVLRTETAALYCLSVLDYELLA